ncbi:hypothetical protein CONPUDRAFT_116825 [Coniophora puteana RWD-64-598 SS2]|uniref:FAD-binding domain-containing protein n=1 Tax=Coniophora puteana (strain RWD-64-598) TaxID=741705 RepID=A0A5M3MZT9_CONPW|nr:uncharacterized protein CONPUDRAFT_116825 [Coniophora puteana RWD-64-598 SS2]EIW84673.1 hypothetical protein CONPUDRAFT_116825 [Coniophora puteana RWD-64-598 SS2]
MSSPAQVLVVGAGPTGLVAALTLLRNGVSVRVIEKEPSPRLGQRGPGNMPRTLEAYHFLDVPEIAQEAARIPPMQSHAFGSLSALKEFPMAPVFDPTHAIPIINPLAIGQCNVERILRSHLEKLGCCVEYGVELLSFEQNEERVLVQTATKDGTSEKIKVQYIVGADGARGVVRKQLGLTFLGETHDETRIVTGDIRFKCTELSRDHWHIFGDEAGNILSFRPSKEFGDNDGWQLFASGEKFDVTSLVSSKDALYTCIRESLAAPVDFVELIWVGEFRPNIRMANKFGEGRVFVAGDAAHVHSPTGGQGLNSGVQDAFNLGWKLALVSKGLAPLSLLDSYTAERLPVIAQMLNITTDLMNKTFGETRGTVENAFHRGRILFMLGVNYRTSPIVLDEFSAGLPPVAAYGVELTDELVAGDRAPDAPGLVEGEATVRLFDIYKAMHHTVLVFSLNVKSARDVIKSAARHSALARTVVILPATTATELHVDHARVLIDRDNYAYSHYLVKDDTRVVVVRPDGVIGAIVAGSPGVDAYFTLIQGIQRS